jgi:hypothetical protein
MRLESPNISVNNPYGLDTQEYNNNWVVPNTNGGLRIDDNCNNNIIFRDDTGMEHTIRTIQPNDISETYNYRIMYLEADLIDTKDKLEKLGDIVLDLKRRLDRYEDKFESMSKQKLTVNFQN